MNELVKAVKTAAADTVKAMKPFAFLYGTVTSTSPLRIEVDQKMTLTADQLLLTNAVRDFSVNATVEHTTEAALGSANIAHTHPYSGNTDNHNHSYTGGTTGNATAAYSGTTQSGGAYNLTHTHAYTGKKKYTFHFGLTVGEKVMLLRCDRGQRFIILDRVEAMK